MASYFSTPGLVDYSCTKIGALYLHEGKLPGLEVSPSLTLTDE